jgi:hypothetical protein
MSSVPTYHTPKLNIIAASIIGALGTIVIIFGFIALIRLRTADYRRSQPMDFHPITRTQRQRGVPRPQGPSRDPGSRV